MSVAESLARAEVWQQEAEQAGAAAQLFEGLPKGIILAERSICKKSYAKGKDQYFQNVTKMSGTKSLGGLMAAIVAPFFKSGANGARVLINEV